MTPAIKRQLLPVRMKAALVHNHGYAMKLQMRRREEWVRGGQIILGVSFSSPFSLAVSALVTSSDGSIVAYRGGEQGGSEGLFTMTAATRSFDGGCSHRILLF